MNKHECRNRIKKRKAKAAAKRKIMILLATAFLIVIGSMIFGNSFSSAKAESDDVEIMYKYYKSIEIESGDSLWSLAQEYKLADTDTQDYIDELIEINDLESETIHSGQYLIVIYYDTEFK